MKQYRLTPAAVQDLSAIWDYTAERWGFGQAEVCVGELRGAIERIADRPERGRPCDEIRAGYRRHAIGSHLIFSVETESTLDVVRILHQRLDPTRHF